MTQNAICMMHRLSKPLDGDERVVLCVLAVVFASALVAGWCGL